jgi:hypothetical protein
MRQALDKNRMLVYLSIIKRWCLNKRERAREMAHRIQMQIGMPTRDLLWSSDGVPELSFSALQQLSKAVIDGDCLYMICNCEAEEFDECLALAALERAFTIAVSGSD